VHFSTIITSTIIHDKSCNITVNRLKLCLNIEDIFVSLNSNYINGINGSIHGTSKVIYSMGG